MYVCKFVYWKQLLKVNGRVFRTGHWQHQEPVAASSFWYHCSVYCSKSSAALACRGRKAQTPCMLLLRPRAAALRSKFFTHLNFNFSVFRGQPSILSFRI